MPRAWETLDRVVSGEGELALRRRDDGDFLITVGQRILMTSRAHRSEVALAERACAGLAACHEPRVLIGGLGMGYTLRAALENLPPRATVVVAEIEAAVLRWCQGPLASLTDGAVDDPRVEVRVEDVGDVIAGAAQPNAARFDAIAVDLFEGPRGTPGEENDPLYGNAALDRAHAALVPGGRYAIWTETPAPGFQKRFATRGFGVSRHTEGKGGRRHVVYVGTAKSKGRAVDSRSRRR